MSKAQTQHDALQWVHLVLQTDASSLEQRLVICLTELSKGKPLNFPRMIHEYKRGLN